MQVQGRTPKIEFLEPSLRVWYSGRKTHGEEDSVSTFLFEMNDEFTRKYEKLVLVIIKQLA